MLRAWKTRFAGVGGLLLCFAGMALLCAMDAVAKALGGHLNTFQITLLRYGGAAVWLALYMLATRADWPRLANWRRHLLRGASMVVTACLFFYGVTHLPLAIATALAMSAPIYVSLLGIIVLGERPTVPTLLAIPLGLAGSAVIVAAGGGQHAGGGDLLGWIAGLLAPVSYAAAIVLLKRHADDESAAALTLGTAMVAAAVLLPVAAPGFAVPDPDTLPLMAILGLLGAAGFVLLTTGLRTTPASSFAVADYSSLLWAAIFGAVFFAEPPGLGFWVGGALIVCACVLGARGAAGKSGAPR